MAVIAGGGTLDQMYYSLVKGGTRNGNHQRRNIHLLLGVLCRWINMKQLPNIIKGLAVLKGPGSQNKPRSHVFNGKKLSAQIATDQ